jgi:hypothetical protein
MIRHAIAAGALLVGLLCTAVRAQEAPCKTGKQAPEFGFWSWAAGRHVKVYLRKDDFSPAEQRQLLTPFAQWNAVSRLTTANVAFDFQGETDAPRTCDNCLTITRERVFEQTRRHATELRAHSARSNRVITHAVIAVDRSLVDPQALVSAVAHELGHSFGLLDCYTCKSRTTVMSQLPELNVGNELEGPTACDILQVRRVYKGLQKRLAQATVAPDEGEEPEDDETPIVPN